MRSIALRYTSHAWPSLFEDADLCRQSCASLRPGTSLPSFALKVYIYAHDSINTLPVWVSHSYRYSTAHAMVPNPPGHRRQHGVVLFPLMTIDRRRPFTLIGCVRSLDKSRATRVHSIDV